MKDPRLMSPGSLMPRYPWLLEDDLDTEYLADKIETMQALGVPYAEGYAQNALADAQAQAQKIAESLRDQGVPEADASKEIIALIAYLQRLGTDIKGASVVENMNPVK